MARTTPGETKSDRRGFLSQISALAACGLAPSTAAVEASQTTTNSQPLPLISLGPHRITRLVAGWNPVGGYSYLGAHADQHMREYFTVERTVEFLLACERAGMNAHQFSPSDKTEAVMRQMQERGSQMKFICLHSGRDGIQRIKDIAAPIAMAHHGGATDQLFAAGKSEQVHDYLKAVHDHGMLAGVSAHNPDCIQRVADAGWEADFFMTCFYFITRKSPPAGAGPGGPQVLEVSYTFYKDDPAVMTRVVRQVKQPCLGFKILAAGRMCKNQDTVRGAFRFAFENIKPTDAVIVGMYPRFFDEMSANARYACEFGGGPQRA